MSRMWAACIIANVHAMIVQQDPKAEEIARFCAARWRAEAHREFGRMIRDNEVPLVQADMTAYLYAFAHRRYIHVEDEDYEECIRFALYLDFDCPLLTIAETDGDVAIAKFLLDAGLHPDGHSIQTNMQGAPLMAAVKAANVPLVRLLVEYGASHYTTFRVDNGELHTDNLLWEFFVAFHNEDVHLTDEHHDAVMLLIHNGSEFPGFYHSVSSQETIEQLKYGLFINAFAWIPNNV